MPPLITISNKKGGVGKTTVAVGLARSLARAGHRVLTIDLDSQGNASYVLGDTDLSDAPTLASVLSDPGAPSPVVSTPDPLIDLVPAGDELLSLGDDARPESMATALDRLTSGEGYGCVVADTEPRLGSTTLSAMAVSSLVLIPTTPELFAISGMLATLDALDALVEAGSTAQARIVLSAVDRSVEHAARVADLHAEHGSRIVGTIPSWVSIRTATAALPGAVEPIMGHAPAVRAVFDRLRDAVIATLSELDTVGSSQVGSDRISHAR